MRGIEFRWARPRGRLAKHFAAPKLFTREVDLHPGREPVPHVRFDPLAVEVDIRGKDLAAEQVVDDERGDVTLAAAGVLRRPVVLRVGRVEAPGTANGLFELRERE